MPPDPGSLGAVEAKAAITPLFLAASAGRLFAVHYTPPHTPPPGVAPNHCSYIFLPPLAEEMNRSRRVAHLLARSLAGAGFNVLILDLFGTGDSEGDFADARWNIWLDDVTVARDWLVAQGAASVGLIGLRMGALLAMEAVHRSPSSYRHLVLWQPVLDGKTMLTQHLRIRLAASLAEGTKETTDALRGLLASGEPLEIAGYELMPELAAQLDQLRLADPDVPIDWIEIARNDDDPLLPASQRLVDSRRQTGREIATTTVGDPPFWSIQETTLAPNLVAKTLQIIQTQISDA